MRRRKEYKEPVMNGFETYKSGPRKGQPKGATDAVIQFVTEQLGWKEVASRSQKKRQFSSPAGDGSHVYFIGSNGSVRAGKSIKDSFSITPRIKAMMEKFNNQ